MLAAIIQSPKERTRTSRAFSTRGCGRNARPYLRAMATVIKMVTVAAALAETAHPFAEDNRPEPAQTTPDTRTINMTDEQFAEFLRHRVPFQDLPWFRDPDRIANASQAQLRAKQGESRRARYYSMIFVELPDRLAAFSGKTLIVDFGRRDPRLVSRLVQALPYYPEITDLYLRNYTARAQLISLLHTTQDLPYLYRIQFRDGALSRNEVTLVAAHRSARRLELVNCQMSADSFPEIGKMTCLEELAVSGDSIVPSNCFVTLAKLPRFRSFFLDDPDPNPFSAAISDETRRAVESMDGRLEGFIAVTMPTTIHASMVRALLKVKSLKHLSIDTLGPGLTVADFQQLEGLTSLMELSVPFGGTYFGSDRESGDSADAIISAASRRAQERRAEDRRRGSSQW